MDIRYYFRPVNFDRIQDGNYLKDKNSLGFLIEKNTSSVTTENIDQFQVAIMGVPDETNSPNKGTKTAPDKIRGYLYQLTGISSKLKIIDLGNVKNGAGKNDLYFAIRDIVDFLANKKVTTIILGGGQDIGFGVSKAFKFNKYFQMTTVDPKIDLKVGRETYDSSNYISRILKDSPELFQINFIGYQSYFVPVKVQEMVKQNLFYSLRLGNLREEIEQVEPILRDSHFLSFDISSVRLQDAPGFYNGSPNGIYSEEACQISRYAGLSPELSVFGIFEVNPKNDNKDQTSKLAAHIIWYFLEGFGLREPIRPELGNSEFTEYNVEIEELNTPLVFFRHNSSNRWWMQIEGIGKNRVYVACKESDYKLAAKKEIPEKWLTFVRKIDRMSK
ncbi:MAG: arginase family protein [Prolixibacteraceae bacterium]|nr:arginase family protein [Prolixibacteraceae bacterium]MBN2775011.1 arginase family protein [Prolixibacteraceae bacterium]